MKMNIMCDKVLSYVDDFIHNHKNLSDAICLMLATICVILFGGWVFAYIIIDDCYDWAKSENIFYFALMAMITLVFGALLHSVFLAIAVFALVALAALCYHCWFVVLPLCILFFAICGFRWLYLRNKKRISAK